MSIFPSIAYLIPKFATPDALIHDWKIEPRSVIDVGPVRLFLQVLLCWQLTAVSGHGLHVLRLRDYLYLTQLYLALQSPSWRDSHRAGQYNVSNESVLLSLHTAGSTLRQLWSHQSDSCDTLKRVIAYLMKMEEERCAARTAERCRQK